MASGGGALPLATNARDGHAPAPSFVWTEAQRRRPKTVETRPFEGFVAFSEAQPVRPMGRRSQTWDDGGGAQRVGRRAWNAAELQWVMTLGVGRHPGLQVQAAQQPRRRTLLQTTPALDATERAPPPVVFDGGAPLLYLVLDERANVFDANLILGSVATSLTRCSGTFNQFMSAWGDLFCIHL